MGHANRSGRHDAFGLDAQPGRICLSARRRCYSNSNADRIANSYGYSDANSHCNGFGYADTNTHCNCDTDSNTDTAANTHP